MYALILVFIIIAAILMVGIVLIQESKGGGLASNFSSYNQIGGVRKTTDFIEKTTWSLAAAMVVLSVASAYTLPTRVKKSTVVQTTSTPAPQQTAPANQQGIDAGTTTDITPVSETPASAAEAEH